MSIATLSTAGIIKDPVQKLDRLLSYMFVADENQTYVFGSNVLTISKLWQRNINRPDIFASELKNAIANYLSGQFTQVQVEVGYTTETNGNVAVTLNIRVYDGNVEYGTDWRFKASNSKIVDVANLLNYGIEP